MKNFDEQMADINRRYRKADYRTKSSCNHLQGWFPPSVSGSNKTSIVWHQFNKPSRFHRRVPLREAELSKPPEIVGVCTGCNRIFRETDFDYGYWFSLPSGNYGSSASGENPANKNWDGKEPDIFAYPATGLDSLSDEEIKFLFEGVQEYRKHQKKLTEYFSGPQWTVKT